jgi:hypothetical protein
MSRYPSSESTGPCVDALSDDAALQLGKHAQQLKHRLAGY